MAGRAAQRANDSVRDYGLGLSEQLELVQAVVLPQGSVEQSELSELAPSQVVHGLGHFDALSDDVAHFLAGFGDDFDGGPGDVGVQGLVLAGQGLPVVAADFVLFDGALAADYDLGVRVLFEHFERVAAGTD